MVQHLLETFQLNPSDGELVGAFISFASVPKQMECLLIPLVGSAGNAIPVQYQ
jgi:hypothetical protein